MNNLSLTACSFMLKKLYTQDEYYYLNEDISVEKEKTYKNFTVQEIFCAFFEKYINTINNDEKKKSFHCMYESTNHGETKDFYYMYAVIKSGTYGSSSDVVNNDTNEIVHRVQPNHTVEKPFYLYVVIPKDNKRVKVQKGMLFFQNIGQYGVKTITTDYMREFFSECFNISLVCKTIAAKLFVERVLTQENVLKLIMTKNHLSGDSVDRLSLGYGVETRMIGNLSFTNNLWEKIKSGIDFFSKGKYNLFEFDGVKYDGLKLYVDIGGRKRTINMNNIENLSLIEGIPDSIQGIDGHPKKGLLLEYFGKVAAEYLQEMVLQIN